MAQRDRSKIKTSLKNKGFQESKGADHDIFILYHNERKTQVFTFISRGSSYKTYHQNLLGKMSRQLKLKNEDLLGLIDCPIGKAEYIKLLESQKIL